MRFGEPHPFPVSGSPTGLSASGQQSYEGWSVEHNSYGILKKITDGVQHDYITRKCRAH